MSHCHARTFPQPRAAWARRIAPPRLLRAATPQSAGRRFGCCSNVSSQDAYHPVPRRARSWRQMAPGRRERVGEAANPGPRAADSRRLTSVGGPAPLQSWLARSLHCRQRPCHHVARFRVTRKGHRLLYSPSSGRRPHAFGKMLRRRRAHIARCPNTRRGTKPPFPCNLHWPPAEGPLLPTNSWIYCLGPRVVGHAVGRGPARDRQHAIGGAPWLLPRAAVEQEPPLGSSPGAGGADRPQPPANALSMALTALSAARCSGQIALWFGRKGCGLPYASFWHFVQNKKVSSLSYNCSRTYWGGLRVHGRCRISIMPGSAGVILSSLTLTALLSSSLTGARPQRAPGGVSAKPLTQSSWRLVTAG